MRKDEGNFNTALIFLKLMKKIDNINKNIENQYLITHMVQD